LVTIGIFRTCGVVGTARSGAIPSIAVPTPPTAPAAALEGRAETRLPESPSGRRAATPLEAAERAALIATIEMNRWNMSNTATQLGISRNTLYRKIKRHGISRIQLDPCNISDARCWHRSCL
jgi:DNA-binding NtrC family response regulator